ncbi:hypothetical protein GUJ93_ZPchr0014g46591 [Zizania palustris]|uniref:Uncharacterized protein n=1 Tax=Zizania palustris TaxID=103762 RepID=A0A8J5W6V5_ZIZPA|nr:hypothetical protein GUJ93_ZPchr0014g46591 [Zizania palustris]
MEPHAKGGGEGVEGGRRLRAPPRLPAASAPSHRLHAPWSPTRQAEEKEERAVVASARLPGFLPPPPPSCLPATSARLPGFPPPPRTMDWIRLDSTVADPQPQQGGADDAAKLVFDAPPPPVREDYVQNAVKFLSHPKVRGFPV